MSQLQSSEEECESLQASLDALEKEKQQSEDALQLEMRNVQGQLASLKDEMTTIEMERKNEIDSLKVNLLI
jgi:chromosome segregation ATPase